MLTVDRQTVAVGDIAQDHTGHWYQIVTVYTQYRFMVQALTPCGADLVPIGSPFMIGRSELRIDQ